MAKEIGESLASTLILNQKSVGAVNTLAGMVRSSTSRSGGREGSERKSFPLVLGGGGRKRYLSASKLMLPKEEILELQPFVSASGRLYPDSGPACH